MSARVLNPSSMMTEMSRNVIDNASGNKNSSSSDNANNNTKRIVPNRAALARVRRDLFGPVDHDAARALAERELRAQAKIDAEKWGFDFYLELPKSNSRYEWQPVAQGDIVPEPYALRGMTYIRKHAPGTPRKMSYSPPAAKVASKEQKNGRLSSSASSLPSDAASCTPIVNKMENNNECTPPQETRVPEIGESTTISTSSATAASTPTEEVESFTKIVEPTTPVLPPSARRQMSITDCFRSRKRTLNGATKSMVEPPEKIARNAGQIRS